MKKNPYSLMFGKKPSQNISREPEIATIIESFENEEAPQQVYVITGVRGSGKTVLMTEISRRIQKDRDWITVELNPHKDMLATLAAALGSVNQLAKIFQEANINLSFFGFGLTVKGSAPITDYELAVRKMLAAMKKQGKKLLVSVDEAANTKEMRTFISAFQIMVHQDLPVFLLMTGLYENINDLQNDKTLTFLYRAPKIELKPLDMKTIAANYEKNLPVSSDIAQKMAIMTKGYSFAFQVMGYFAFESGGFTDETVENYRRYLEEYSYEKIWSELSDNDKKVVYGTAMTKTGKIVDIRSFLSMETNQFNPYRKRLIRKGIADGSRYGYLFLTLPFFGRYAAEEYESEHNEYLDAE